ncbi:hypothetical protein ACFQS3_02500 [Glycomyces mayteni]|uniref:Uncharacterized protein n=1 Tax=Glycomyces mayteni TaxID=543887 RepID=A0ABW2D3K4_9ACTN|nr:hypothetical protein GCM10025732_47980 [Glycomyces mayteni]
MKIRIQRKYRRVRLDRTELQVATAALAAYHAQSVSDGLAAETETDYIIQSGLTVKTAHLRGRLILAQRGL